ncbi:hypothetical protein [Sandaracinobacteroides saxicola]|uniref:Uncharacterized protein n=1 Tax=Sandaracinobacteroides saxicola TaxID=2759707 RepID=A0A7G5IFY9_9SPHN|nr:hypothetical protein [Sandaracinobacteroides saxicola]QMW22281.1 hypothetical protein H3309_13080 [Sandaracinobacteroides saxicola]
MIKALMGSAFLLMAAAVSAQSATTATAAQSATTTQAAPAAKDPTICKRTETTGTRLGTKRICKLKSEWDAEARLAQQQFGRAVDAGNIGQPRGN